VKKNTGASVVHPIPTCSSCSIDASSKPLLGSFLWLSNVLTSACRRFNAVSPCSTYALSTSVAACWKEASIEKT
jgi:hypothetical protein